MKKDFHTDVLILGAGIGGYETFRTLAKLFRRKRIKKTITLIDQHNYFTFTPMLHEVASGAIEPQHCAIPLRGLVYKTKHKFVKATVKNIDPKNRKVLTNRGVFLYKYCVLALGSKTNYYNIPGAKEHSYHVRDLESAIALQEAVVECLESPTKEDIHITIVGGGFTGIEVAGQLSHMFRSDIKKLYKEKRLHINIIESGETILKNMPLVVRRKVSERLEKQGVHIQNNSSAKKITESDVILNNDIKLHSDITVWCGGFLNIADSFLPKGYTERGRVPVTDCLVHEKAESLYAVGDIVLFHDQKSGLVAPQLGEAAHKEGKYVARNIVKKIKGKKCKSFRFKSRGTLIPVGDWYGVAIIGRIIFFGRIAWWIRRTAYLFFLPGIIRKIKIVIDWTLHALGFRYIIDMHDPRD